MKNKFFNKIYLAFFAIIIALSCVFTINIDVNAATDFILNPCEDTTCTGEYVNGFCDECDAYQPAPKDDYMYLISNAGQLYWFMNKIEEGNTDICGKLTKNIIINEGDVLGCNGTKKAEWREWISNQNEFSGDFDGAGFYVSGLYQKTTSPSFESGFFGNLRNAKISNLNVINSYFRLEASSTTGGIVGFSKYSQFFNCSVEANFSSTHYQLTYLGGFTGCSGDDKYENCSSNVKINVTNAYDASVGGFIGSSYYNAGSLKNIISSAIITVPTEVVEVGSVIGNTRSFTYENVYYDSQLYATAYTGNHLDEPPTATGLTTSEISSGTACTNVGTHFYKTASDSTHHYNECLVCGTQTSKSSHSLGAPATCSTLATCYTCGEEYGDYDYTKHVSEEFDSNGYSTCCGKGYEPITLVTDTNYIELGLSSEYIGYYAIGNAGQLFDFSYKHSTENDTYSTSNVVLINDIDVNPGYIFNSDDTVIYDGAPAISGWKDWQVIGYDLIADDGYVTGSYSGIFDGNYHTISGLYVNEEEMNYVGFIGNATSAEFKNLGIINSYFKGNRYVGGISGYTSWGTRFTNCYSEATIISTVNYGAAGIVSAGTSTSTLPAVIIENCYYNGVNKSSGSYVSGLYGSNNGTVINSYFNYSKFTQGPTNQRKTDEQFKSGEVAYLLNGDQSTITYGQTIGTQNYPVFNGATVYGGYLDCESYEMVYTNDENHDLNPTIGHMWDYSANGTTITATCTQPTCSISDRTETISIEAMTTEDLTYTGEQKPAKVIVSVDGLLPYTVVYKNGLNEVLSSIPVTVGTYTAEIILGTATISVTYEITKGILSGTASSNVEYGRNHEEKEITGKVVIEGTTTEVPGTWTWVSGTTKATFTPSDLTLYNLLENIDVNITDVADEPVININSPVSNISPGQSVILKVEAENKYGNNTVDLPTQFTYKYKVGLTGTETAFTDGLLVVPSSAPIGETIYVTVSSLAVDNKYSVGTSTIEILVVGSSGSVVIGANGNWFIDGSDTGKKVDYTTDIDAVNTLLTQETNRLQGLIESNDADIDTINQSITNINNTITALDDAYKLADSNLQTVINEVKENLEKSLSNTSKVMQGKLDMAVAKLNDADEANAAQLAKAVEELNGLIDSAEALAKANDETLKTDLESQLTVVKEELNAKADKVQANLDEAVKLLEENITSGNNANAEELTKAVKTLNESIASVEALAKANDETLKSNLESQLSIAKISLNDAVNKVQENLDAAIKSLEEKITSGNKASAAELAKAVEELNALIDSAEALAKSDDESLKALLVSAIEASEKAAKEADAALRSELLAELEKARQEAAEKDAMLKEELSQDTDDSVVLPTVVAFVAVAGNIGLLAWILIDRKRRSVV